MRDSDGDFRAFTDDEFYTMENVDSPLNDEEVKDELERLIEKKEKFDRRKERKQYKKFP